MYDETMADFWDAVMVMIDHEVIDPSNR